MHDKTVSCCDERSCWTMPFEFVRVRYFYGQRLGVMELADEAAYHAGKHAFHNARLHGVGVLCGLTVERYAFVPATPTTVLRVTRGAALDACGRELLVGGDQCVDVLAWYGKNRGRSEVATWAAGSERQLIVAVRYRECPSDPAPAPRDPCGCDQNGSEFGRVREGFELALLLPSERDQLVRGAAPLRDELVAALSGGPREAQDARLAALLARACSEPEAGERWLALATLTLAFDAAGTAITDIAAVDSAPAERLSLLPTHALQALVAELAGGLADSGALSSGPRYGALDFAPTSATAGTLSLPLQLATVGEPPLVVPLASATFDAGFVRLYRLDATGWTDATHGVALDTASSPPRITLTVTVAAGDELKPHRLAVDAPAATPIADARGNALAPYARTFGFASDGTTLTLAGST